MGNQGHAFESLRRLTEYLQAGAIGDVIETHSWQGWVYGIRKPAPAEPVPPGMHWDEYIGPAPFRPFRKDIHPNPGWLQWRDFGTGVLGGMGPHVLDPVYFGLKLGHPASVEAVAQIGGDADSYPTLNTLRYDFPARGSMPPVKVYWYDGTRPGADLTLIGYNPQPQFLHRPALADELEKRHDCHFPSGGTLFVGTKGIMHCGPYSESPRIIPEAEHQKFPPPPKTLHRTKDILEDFLQACRGGPAPCSNFTDYAGPFMEAMLVGLLATSGGSGRKVQWDGPAMNCTNLPELNRLVQREYRKGWEL
jgi:predicted dehydrogenase